MAKGLANGLPIGAVMTTPKLAESLAKQQINTFGGNPVSSATAIAVLETIEEEKLMNNAHVVGGYLMEKGKLAVLMQPAELIIIGGWL